MATFKDFLNERNITLKRKYTEAYPAKTVGSSARVRNAIIEALKDGKITVEEFNDIVSQHSSAPAKWTRGNKRFFKIEEDGVSLSRYGQKILNSLVTESINEKSFDKMVSKSKYDYDSVPSSLDLKDDERNLDEPAEMKNIKKFQKKYGTKTKVTTDNKPIGKRVTVYMEPGVEDGPDEIMEPQLQRHEEMMDFVKKHNLKISIANTVKGEWTFWTRYGVDESAVTEARVDAKKLLKSVVNGETNSVEGIKLSKGMAQAFSNWLESSTYGKKFSKLPWDMLFTAAFNWGIERYAKSGELKDELKDLKTKAKAMKESKIYESFNKFVINEKSMKDWFLANIDSFKDEKEYMKAGKKAGFSKKELEDAMDDFEQGGEDYLESNEVTEGLNKSDVAYQLAIDYTGRTKPKITKLNKKRIQIKYGYKISPQKVIDSIKAVHPEVELKHVEWSDAMSGGGFHIFDILESAVIKESKNDMIHTKFTDFVNETYMPVNEALKSSKLRGLISMKKGSKDILKAIYGFSKIALDKIEDYQIQDIDPKQGKKAEGLVVYYTTQDKENPYVDRSSNSSWTQSGNFRFEANTILGIGIGKDVAYMTRHYDRKSGKTAYSLTTQEKSFSRSNQDIGINKKYRGWDSTGVYNVKRMIDLADGAFVINPKALPDTDLKTYNRAKAREGAVAFKSDKEFRDANVTRYREILQKRANELPIDKLVMDAIDDATNVMKDGLKNQEKNKYGELIAGVGKDGRAYKLNDISHFISNLISDYERWSGYMKTIEDAEAKYGEDSKEFEWETSYSRKESEEYAKRIKDKLAKLKKRNLAW